METEFLMEIAYIFKNGEKGKRIVGGADSKYPTKDLSWINFTNKNVMIMIKEEAFLFKVKKVDVFPSISGALNIGLTLYEDTNFDSINIGDKVYKIQEVV